MQRDLHNEIDLMKNQITELQQVVAKMVSSSTNAAHSEGLSPHTHPAQQDNSNSGSVYYSAQIRSEDKLHRWEPQERSMDRLLTTNSEKLAKILNAFAHKQRIEILKSVCTQPLSGAELVEKLNMGTTGQLYHHLKALQGADLLIQDQSGKYTVPRHRALPFLLLLAAVNELLDTSRYIEMTETRNHAGAYLGPKKDIVLQARKKESILPL